MRILVGFLLFTALSGCSFAPKDLKSPCVANDQFQSDGSVLNPCIRRNVNDHWLG